MSKKYTKDGRLVIPISDRKKSMDIKIEEKVRYIIEQAFCPKGCNLVDPDHPINNFPGVRIKFKRQNMEGEFVVSAIEGDFSKIVLSGQLKKGVKYELHCPHCDAQFAKLVNCNCKPDAEMVVIGFTPTVDFNEAVTFCNVSGCVNGTYIKSGDAIRHVRLQGVI